MAGGGEAERSGNPTSGETPEKQAYVEEGIYAHGSDVASVSIDSTDYEVTEVTQDVVDARAY